MKINTKCYYCNSNKFDFYDSENGFNLVKCCNCGLIYVNPRPSDADISKSVQMGMHNGQKRIKTTGRYFPSKVDRYLRILKDFFPKEIFENKDLKWLDIGCGFGEFMEALKKYSNNNLIVKGSEPNDKKIKSARERDLCVSYMDLNDIKEKYDFISLLNVYSHLPNPMEFLSNIKEKLNPGGTLFLETGHTSHLPACEHPKPYNLPDHLSFVNKEILQGILRKSGFNIIDIRLYRSPHYPKYYEIKSIIIQLVRIILGKKGRIRNFFPKHPNIDMYVRCERN